MKVANTPHETDKFLLISLRWRDIMAGYSRLLTSSLNNEDMEYIKHRIQFCEDKIRYYKGLAETQAMVDALEKN